MQQQFRDAPPRRRTETSADAAARGLGYFSIALGAAEFLAPHALARWLGRPEAAGVIRACGLREVGTGLGILTAEDPGPWVRARVAGDLFDLAALACCAGPGNERRANARLALGTVAAVTALDVLNARTLQEADSGHYVAPDFSDRSGFPRPAAEMRGAAAREKASPQGSRAVGPTAVVEPPDADTPAATLGPGRTAAAPGPAASGVGAGR